MKNIQDQLIKAVGDTPIISVSQKPIDFGLNICVGDIGRSAYNIYKQVLIAVREAKTKYVATAEDDVLYPREHFECVPPDDVLMYDVNKWCTFTWSNPPIFSKRKNRRTMTSLIAPRETLLKTLEERYAVYPREETVPLSIYKYYWGEPGRFENHLGINTVRTRTYESVIAQIQFSTPESLGFAHLGRRKRLGEERTELLPYWGSALEIMKLYK